jgi:hypothetical protein
LPVANAFVDKSLPNSPAPSTPSSKAGSGRFGTPIRDSPRPRHPASFRKENSLSPAKTYSSNTPSDPRLKSNVLTPEVTISTRPTSSIPTLGTSKSNISPLQHRNTISGAPRGLSERPGLANILPRPSLEPSEKPAPLRINSTQAAPATRKLRIQSPQKFRERLGSLQDEIDKIGEELGGNSTTVAALTSKIASMEADVTSSLAVSSHYLHALGGTY